MLADRHQCIEIYSEVESKISIGGVLKGPDKTAHSTNKILYGVFENFLQFFKSELDAIDMEFAKTANAKEEAEMKAWRVIFERMIMEFEANERLTYSTVAFNQRGRIPLSIIPGSMGIKYFFQNDWLNDDRADLEHLQKTERWVVETDPNEPVPPPGAAKPKSENLPSKKFLAQFRGWRKWGNDEEPSETESETAENAAALEPEVIGKDKFTSKDEKIIAKMKDVYHEALEELLEVCDQSLLGLTSIIELYKLKREYDDLEGFKYDGLVAMTDDLSSAQYARKILRAGENLKREITRQYFLAEVEDRKKATRPDISQLRKQFYSTPDF